MRILLSGGHGFLGHRVLEMLIDKGYEVRTITRRPAPDLKALGAETYQADLLDAESVSRAAQGVDGVIHCAARSGIWGPLDDYIQANTMTTYNILNAAQKAGATWFVHTSSPSVVHTGKPLNGVDESAPYTKSPTAPYPYSKMLAEKLVLAANGSSFKTTALRPHLIWGPGDPHFLPRLTTKARSGRLWLLKSEALIDGTYIDNAAQAHLLAAEKLAAGHQAIAGHAYFIAQGEPLTAPDLVARLLKAASEDGENLAIKGLIPAWLGKQIGHSMEIIWKLLKLRSEPPLTRFVAEELSLPHWFNLKSAETELGYKASVSISEGLEKLRQSVVNSSQ